MTKKEKLIFYLVISLLSLLYIVLDFFGVIRKINLNLWSVESWKESYPKLEKADIKNKTVVAFNAFSDKVQDFDEKKFRPFLNSLLDQSVRVDDISMSIPYKDMNKIPPWVRDVVSVNGHSKEYKGGSAVVYSVLQEPESNTKIIVVEPDYVYPKEFVQDTVDKSNETPDKIIYVDKGILIKPSFFDEKITEYDAQSGVGIIEWLKENYGK